MFLQETFLCSGIKVNKYMLLFVTLPTHSLALPFFSVKPRKGNVPHKRWMGALDMNHGKCRPCPVVHSNSVCGSDGHTYSSKVRYSSCEWWFNEVKLS